MRTLEQRERRLARARTASRIEVGLGTLAVALPPILVLLAPPLSGGISRGEPPLELRAIPGIAYGLLVVGYLWMIRIRFTGPDDGARSNWRSH